MITITKTSPAVAPSTLVLLLSGPYRNGVDYYHSGDRNGVRASVVTELITIKGGAVAVRIKSSHIPKKPNKASIPYRFFLTITTDQKNLNGGKIPRVTGKK